MTRSRRDRRVRVPDSLRDVRIKVGAGVSVPAPSLAVAPRELGNVLRAARAFDRGVLPALQTLVGTIAATAVALRAAPSYSTFRECARMLRPNLRAIDKALSSPVPLAVLDHAMRAEIRREIDRLDLTPDQRRAAKRQIQTWSSQP